MKTKLVIIGAGSVSFGPSIFGDLFSYAEKLRGAEVWLVDTNTESLDVMVRYAAQLNEATNQPYQIHQTTDRNEALPGAKTGWTVKYTTDLTQEVWFYLRGEEYSAQIDYFVTAIGTQRTDNVNSFRSAMQADRLVGMILAEAGGAARPAPPATADKAKGFWARRFG